MTYDGNRLCELNYATLMIEVCYSMIRSKKRFFIKTIIKLLFFLLLIIVTLINAFHIDNGFSSTDLTLKTTKIDAGTRHDYLDSEGNITLATDKGYASIIEKHISDRESIFNTWTKMGYR